MKNNLIILALLIQTLFMSCQNKKQEKQVDQETTFEGEDFTYVTKNNKSGFVDGNGKKITEIIYDGVGNFFEGKAAVSIGNKYGFIDTKGKQVVPFIYDQVGQFKNGMANVAINKKNGYINAAGVVVIDLKYDHADDFDEFGFARVGTIISFSGNLNTNKYGLIDKKGTEIVPIIYDSIDTFLESKVGLIASVTNNKKSGVVDAKGKIIIPLQYELEDDLYSSSCLLSKGLFRFTKNGKYLLVNASGKEITPAIYDYISDCDEETGKIPVTLNGNEIYIDVNGKVVK